MRTAILINPRAGGGRTGRAWPAYCRAIGAHLGPCAVLVSQRPGDAEQIVRNFAHEGPGRLVIVGGDGTLNEAVNGLFDPSGRSFLGEHVELVPYPAGTGQDFSRSVGLSRRGLCGTHQLLLGSTRRWVDVGRIALLGHDGAPKVRHFINIASLGMSAQIVDKVAQRHWRWGMDASFFVRSLQVAYRHRNRRIVLRVDDHDAEEPLINTVAIANGRYFGRAMKIAPDALVDDGQFDVVTMGDISWQTFLTYSLRLYRGQHVGLPQIRVMRGACITAYDVKQTLACNERTALEMDGELPGTLPAKITVLPARIAIWAPWYRAEATGEGKLRGP